MPIPTPTPEEKKSKKGQQAFMENCLHSLKDENRPHKQKIAICTSKYRNAKKRKKVSGGGNEPQWDELLDPYFNVF